VVLEWGSHARMRARCPVPNRYPHINTSTTRQAGDPARGVVRLARPPRAVLHASPGAPSGAADQEPPKMRPSESGTPVPGVLAHRRVFGSSIASRRSRSTYRRHRQSSSAPATTEPATPAADCPTDRTIRLPRFSCPEKPHFHSIRSASPVLDVTGDIRPTAELRRLGRLVLSGCRAAAYPPTATAIRGSSSGRSKTRASSSRRCFPSYE